MIRGRAMAANITARQRELGDFYDWVFKRAAFLEAQKAAAAGSLANDLPAGRDATTTVAGNNEIQTVSVDKENGDTQEHSAAESG